MSGVDSLGESSALSSNNLVFYGIKCDSGINESPAVVEAKVREVLVHHMHITRDVLIQRVRRSWNGPDIRGSKPITVSFDKWHDKEDVLRKGKLLRGSHIYVGEDFSKKVKEHRAELMRFMREIKRRNPKVKCSLKYDKLFINKDIYAYNDMSGMVEQIRNTELEQIYDKLLFSSSPTTPRSSSISPTRRRRTKSSHANLKKSHSTESGLHTLSPNSPVHENGKEGPQSDANGIEHEGEDNGMSTSMAEDESDSECVSKSNDTESGRRESPRRKSNPNIPETIPE
ncbi:unnamed protein product [Lepeophtheirus salmonis]|uniref:(salmon louse) hypothetical protein n=1 Tax=Lepeophtheirus salmonis TaxID=72036 RepID=A0A7R8HBN7_LEPSM|nr:unnamed protein product [Lepeophtheirus salmonis]CAF2984862.1 unnamed protein product [Lepeophtheirus salmonis]